MEKANIDRIRSIMRQDDACEPHNLVPSDLRELVGEIDRLQSLVDSGDADCEEIDRERQKYQDAIVKIHRALGGDGIWLMRLPPELPPNSGEVDLDALDMAKDLVYDLRVAEELIERCAPAVAMLSSMMKCVGLVGEDIAHTLNDDVKMHVETRRAAKAAKVPE